MPKISQLPNKPTPTLADILPLLDTATNSTKSITITEIANAMINSITPSGIVVPFAGSTAPSGWLLCYGQAVSRTTYANLYAAIGITFGAGDGSTTFNLPDLRGRVVAGVDAMGGSAASRLTNSANGGSNGALGNVGGEQAHTLTSGEQASMYVHKLNQGDYVNVDSGGSYGGWDLNAATTNQGLDRAVAQGGGGAHNTVQPTLVLNYMIRT